MGTQYFMPESAIDQKNISNDFLQVCFNFKDGCWSVLMALLGQVENTHKR